MEKVEGHGPEGEGKARNKTTEAGDGAQLWEEGEEGEECEGAACAWKERRGIGL